MTVNAMGNTDICFDSTNADKHTQHFTAVKGPTTISIIVDTTEICIKAWDQQMQASNKKKEEIQEKFEHKLKALGVTGGRFIFGIEKPGEFIVETAKKENVSYIVMGTRGQGKLRRTIMGSVSDYVVHHIHCPVIVSRT